MGIHDGEPPLPLFRMHWDHEPADRAVASWSAPALWRFRSAPLPKAPEDWRTKTWRGLRRLPLSSLASAREATKPYFHAKWYPEGMGCRISNLNCHYANDT